MFIWIPRVTNKTETAVQSQDDAKNLYIRQNLNLIKKTENPSSLQDNKKNDVTDKI